jgi:hypothetical protein
MARVSSGNFGLRIQELPRVNDRVLALGLLAGRRLGTDWFAPADVAALFELLRLPPPAHVGRSLAQLRAVALVIHDRTKQSWSVTPVGERKVSSLLGDIDYARISVELAMHPGAQFAQTMHPVIDPSFAPPRWVPGILRLLDRYPFETNVFCMTRFPSSQTNSSYIDPVEPVLDVVRGIMGNHGLNLHLASDRQLDDELFGNVGAYMWACQYGIGLLEDRGGRGLNYNVVIEVGAMLMTGRRCALLKDRTAPSLPTDLSGQIYKSVDFDDLVSVSEQAHRWVAEDLCLGRCDDCP